MKRGARPEGRQALHDDPRAVLLQLRPRPADRRVRRRDRAQRRAEGLHDDRPALPARGQEGDQGDALRPRRPGRRGDLDQPQERRDPRDDGRHAGQQARTSSTCSRRRGASRARPSRPSCSPPRSSRGSTRRRRRYLSAPFFYQPDPNGNCEDGTLVVPGDLRPQLHRLDVDRDGRRCARTTRSTPS